MSANGETLEFMDNFESVALPYMNDLFRAASSVLGSRSEAEDIVQETHLQAWKSFHRFTLGTNCRAWLFKILFHVIQHHRRNEKKDGRHPPAPQPARLPRSEQSAALRPISGFHLLLSVSSVSPYSVQLPSYTLVSPCPITSSACTTAQAVTPDPHEATTGRVTSTPAASKS